MYKNKSSSYEDYQYVPQTNIVKQSSDLIDLNNYLEAQKDKEEAKKVTKNQKADPFDFGK